MSLSLGEALVDMFREQNPFDSRRDWLSSVVGWRVSAEVYDELARTAAGFDPAARSAQPLVTWQIVRDPRMPAGHAVPFDAAGNALSVVGPRPAPKRSTER